MYYEKKKKKYWLILDVGEILGWVKLTQTKIKNLFIYFFKNLNNL